MSDALIEVMHEYVIGITEPSEYPLFDDFLYETIFAPEVFDGEKPRSIIYENPKCFAAIKDFGSLPGEGKRLAPYHRQGTTSTIPLPVGQVDRRPIGRKGLIVLTGS